MEQEVHADAPVEEEKQECVGLEAYEVGTIAMHGFWQPVQRIPSLQDGSDIWKINKVASSERYPMLFVASVYTISVFPVHWGREYDINGPNGWERVLGEKPQAVLRLPYANGDGYGEINRLICQTTQVDGSAECLVACNDDGLVVGWRTEAITNGDLRPYRQFKNPEGTWSLALSPSHGLLATGSNSHEITLFDLASGALVRTLRGHEHNIPSLSFGPDGVLVSSSIDGTCRLWNISDEATDDEPAVLQIGGEKWVWSSAVFKVHDIHRCDNLLDDQRMVAQSQDFQAPYSETPLPHSGWSSGNLARLFEDEYEGDEDSGDGRRTIDDQDFESALMEEYEFLDEYFTDPADLEEIWHLADVAIEEQLHQLEIRSLHRSASIVQAEEPPPRVVHRIPLPCLEYEPLVPVVVDEPRLTFSLPDGCGYFTVCLAQKEMFLYSSTRQLLWSCEDVLFRAYGRRHYDWNGWRLQRFSLLEACPELSCLVAGNQCGAVVIIHFIISEDIVTVNLLGVPLFEDYLVSLKGMTLRRLTDRPHPAYELFLLYTDGIVKSFRLERRQNGLLKFMTSNLP